MSCCQADVCLRILNVPGPRGKERGTSFPLWEAMLQGLFELKERDGLAGPNVAGQGGAGDHGNAERARKGSGHVFHVDKVSGLAAIAVDGDG